MDTADIVIAGGGIAGASMAYFLVQQGINHIVLLEREATLAHHSSGRSAAINLEWDADPVIQALQVLSRDFFYDPPDGFTTAEAPIFHRTGVLDWPRRTTCISWNRKRRNPKLPGSPSNAGPRTRCVPVSPFSSRNMWVAGSTFPTVAILPFTSYSLLISNTPVMRARHGGVQVRTGAEITSVDCIAGRVSAVHTTQGTIQTRCLVNATGAWADDLYALAGGTPLGITPIRRTIIMPTPPDWYEPGPWPFVHELSHHFYMKPEGHSIIASPMYEDPIEPCDARPNMLRVAEIADRLECWTQFTVEHIDRRWAGLRSFAPDRRPVVGEDPHIAGFFWLAGQGGVGILTSPSLSRIAAELLVYGETSLMDATVISSSRLTAL